MAMAMAMHSHRHSHRHRARLWLSPKCPLTEISIYQKVHLPKCPLTEISIYRKVRLPICLLTDLSAYRFVRLPICLPVYFMPMPTKHGLHQYYVTVAGDVALVLVYPSDFKLPLKITCFLLWLWYFPEMYLAPGHKKVPRPCTKVTLIAKNMISRRPTSSTQN